MRPLCIDLYCGLGGWTEGFLAEGWRVIGFDIVRPAHYPGQLVLQDVATLHGRQFRQAHMIVASPPCQEYSYRAMPWKRAKALPAPSNGLFEAPFRIQQEASAAAGRYIPLIVENVQGAQPWVGRARWHHGSYYLWGDVPALMPVLRGFDAPIARSSGAESTESTPSSALVCQSKNGTVILTPPGGLPLKNPGHVNRRYGASHTRHLTNPRESEGVKQRGSGPVWFDIGIAHHSSKSRGRKAASAEIAKIPLSLAEYIAGVFKP